MTRTTSSPRKRASTQMWVVLNYSRVMQVGAHRGALIREIFGDMKEWQQQKRRGHVSCQRCTVLYSIPKPKRKVKP